MWLWLQSGFISLLTGNWFQVEVICIRNNIFMPDKRLQNVNLLCDALRCDVMRCRALTSTTTSRWTSTSTTLCRYISHSTDYCQSQRRCWAACHKALSGWLDISICKKTRTADMAKRQDSQEQQHWRQHANMQINALTIFSQIKYAIELRTSLCLPPSLMLSLPLPLAFSHELR